MTLSTHVYLLTEADPADVFLECRRLIGATDQHTWKDEPSFYSEKPDGERVMSNDCGQGLPAWLLMRYIPGAMVRASHAEHDPDICDEDCDGKWHKPAHWIDIDFDTAYGYRDANGGCGTLHARILFELGGWLDERGIQWAWQNEFTGEIHVGDKYEHLRELVDGGQAAVRWFKGTVEPVIASLGARNG
jgi:hypothetical protein